MEGEIFRTRPDRPLGPTQTFRTSSSADVKERVGLFSAPSLGLHGQLLGLLCLVYLFIWTMF